MKKTFTITAPDGIHARPAALLVNAAANFTSDIIISYEGQEANLKSILSVMALSIPSQAAIELSGSGDDAEAALDYLEQFIIDQDLGEICEK